MRPMTQDTILKELNKIYRCALKNQKWHVALQALERHAHYTILFEKQNTLHQLILKKQDPGLTHPPPPA